jgi:hypothetical protein
MAGKVEDEETSRPIGHNQQLMNRGSYNCGSGKLKSYMSAISLHFYSKLSRLDDGTPYSTITQWKATNHRPTIHAAA